VLQAALELSSPSSGERELLEALSNHLGIDLPPTMRQQELL
jgi:hypothetical protein